MNSLWFLSDSADADSLFAFPLESSWEALKKKNRFNFFGKALRSTETSKHLEKVRKWRRKKKRFDLFSPDHKVKFDFSICVILLCRCSLQSLRLQQRGKPPRANVGTPQLAQLGLRVHGPTTLLFPSDADVVLFK